MTGKLEPCPFCGDNNQRVVYNPDLKCAFVMCDACGAVVSFVDNTQVPATVALYNTRGRTTRH